MGSSLLQHVHREHNQLADTLANRAASNGTLTYVNKLTYTPRYMLMFFDGSFHEDRAGAGALVFVSQQRPQNEFVETDWDLGAWIGVKLTRASTNSAVQAELVGALLCMAMLSSFLCEDLRIFDLQGDQPFEVLCPFLCKCFTYSQ